MSPLSILSLFAAIIVLVRTVCLAAHMSAEKWQGHPLRFIGLAATYSLLAAGAFCVVFLQPYGPLLLLLGVAGMILFERRRGHA